VPLTSCKRRQWPPRASARRGSWRLSAVALPVSSSTLARHPGAVRGRLPGCRRSVAAALQRHRGFTIGEQQQRCVQGGILLACLADRGMGQAQAVARGGAADRHRRRRSRTRGCCWWVAPSRWRHGRERSPGQPGRAADRRAGAVHRQCERRRLCGFRPRPWNPRHRRQPAPAGAGAARSAGAASPSERDQRECRLAVGLFAGARWRSGWPPVDGLERFTGAAGGAADAAATAGLGARPPRAVGGRDAAAKGPAGRQHSLSLAVKTRSELFFFKVGKEHAAGGGRAGEVHVLQ